MKLIDPDDTVRQLVTLILGEHATQDSSSVFPTRANSPAPAGQCTASATTALVVPTSTRVPTITGDAKRVTWPTGPRS